MVQGGVAFKINGFFGQINGCVNVAFMLVNQSQNVVGFDQQGVQFKGALAPVASFFPSAQIGVAFAQQVVCRGKIGVNSVQMMQLCQCFFGAALG